MKIIAPVKAVTCPNDRSMALIMDADAELLTGRMPVDTAIEIADCINRCHMVDGIIMKHFKLKPRK